MTGNGIAVVAVLSSSAVGTSRTRHGRVVVAWPHLRIVVTRGILRWQMLQQVDVGAQGEDVEVDLCWVCIHVSLLPERERGDEGRIRTLIVE